MVQAGETGGFLDVVLAQIADFQSREKELRSKVMAAMLYPCILLVLALAVLIFLLTFFIPRVSEAVQGFRRRAAVADADHPRRSAMSCGPTACLSPSGLCCRACWFATGLRRKRAAGVGGI